MARRLLQFSVAAALIIAVGGHWAVLQSVAWVSMAVTYSKTDSLEVALKKTFGGRHPCKLCVAVKEGKQEEQKQPVLKIETKLDIVCLQAVTCVHPALPFNLLSCPSDVAHPRDDAPPVGGGGRSDFAFRGACDLRERGLIVPTPSPGGDTPTNTGA